MQSRFYCPSFAYCRFSLRDAGRGRPFRFLPQAGRVPRQETICPPSAVNAVGASDLPPPFLFLRGCRKGPPPLPLSSAGGGVYPAEERFSVCQDATTCRPLPFHPFRKLLPKENRFRYTKPGARHSRVPGFASLVQRGFILSARLLTGENLPPTRSAAASPSTGSWSPRRFPTHNAHRGRSAPRTSCTSRPTAQPSPRQW